MQQQDFVLGVDLDGVVGHYVKIFRECVAEQTGVDPATLGPQTSWDFADCNWGVRDRDHFLELHKTAVLEMGMFRRMPVLPGASETLWELSDAGVHIRIITHRLCFPWGHAVTVADTVSWLDDNKIPYRDICFIADKPQVGADLYLDDAEHNIAGLRASGADAWIFDADYNRHVEGPRVHDWDEVRTGVNLVLEERGR